MLDWMFQHDCLDTYCFGVSYACVFYFCICTCSGQLSLFHTEKRSRNMLIIIIIIIISSNRLVGLMVKAPASRASDLGSIPAFAVDLFPSRVIPVA